MKTLSEKLGSIIGLGIDLNLFYSINVSTSNVSILGHHTDELEAYLTEKGFTLFEYLYSDNPNVVELTKDGCRIALDKS